MKKCGYSTATEVPVLTMKHTTTLNLNRQHISFVTSQCKLPITPLDSLSNPPLEK